MNVIEAHPRLPLLAVSGIDTTVKVRFDWISYSEVQDDLHILELFAPSRGESEFSRLRDAANIIEANARRGSNRQYFSLANVIHHYHAAVRATAGDDAADEQCAFSEIRARIM